MHAELSESVKNGQVHLMTTGQDCLGIATLEMRGGRREDLSRAAEAASWCSPYVTVDPLYPM